MSADDTRPDIPAVPTIAAEPSGAGSPAPAPVERPATATGPAEGAEAALGRVAALAESWAALVIPGMSGDDVAAEADAHCGRRLLDFIHGPSSADVRLSRVTALAEAWMAPGGPALFYPAAGQAVLDAIRGASTEEAAGWRERAEAAEARLAALGAHAPAIVDALRHALAYVEHVPHPSSQAAAERYRSALATIGTDEGVGNDC